MTDHQENIHQLCNSCEELKPLDQFRVSVARGKAYRRSTCNACLKVYWTERDRQRRQETVEVAEQMHGRMVTAALEQVVRTRRARN